MYVSIYLSIYYMYIYTHTWPARCGVAGALQSNSYTHTDTHMHMRARTHTHTHTHKLICTHARTCINNVMAAHACSHSQRHVMQSNGRHNVAWNVCACVRVRACRRSSHPCKYRSINRHVRLSPCKCKRTCTHFCVRIVDTDIPHTNTCTATCICVWGCGRETDKPTLSMCVCVCVCVCV